MIRDLLTTIGIVFLIGTFWIFSVFNAMGVPIQKVEIQPIVICDPYEYGADGNDLIYHILNVPLYENNFLENWQESIIPIFLNSRPKIREKLTTDEYTQLPVRIFYGCNKA